MEIRDTTSSRFVRLEPVSYQFPIPYGDDFDDNWLILRGHARSDEEEWTFQEPSLLVDEAHGISAWMRSAGVGTETLLVADAEGFTHPATETIEPNIGMGLVRHDTESVTVRVFLWLESAPPSTWDGRAKRDMQFFIDITTTPNALERAAADWDAELAKFPRR
jgi:hypothetical protein